MATPLERYRMPQPSLVPEADPYGQRGLGTRNVGQTSPVPVPQTSPTPVPKPPVPSTGLKPPPNQGIVTPVERTPITTTNVTPPTNATPVPKPGGTVVPPSGATPVPKPTGRVMPPAGGTGTTGPGGPGTNQPTVPGTTGVPPSSGIISGGPPASFSPYNVVTDNLNNLLSSDSRYIRNARQRGMEAAAGRGLINSSIAAGTAERAAIESSMPILNQIMGLTSQRESQAFQQQFAQTQATLQDWANNRQFEREFNAQLSLIPIASSADMWGSLINLAANDPTVFTPTVLAGYQDFFQNGFNEYVGRYLEGIDFGVPGGP